MDIKDAAIALNDYLQGNEWLIAVGCATDCLIVYANDVSAGNAQTPKLFQGYPTEVKHMEQPFAGPALDEKA